MDDNDKTEALFPLHTVLFPGSVLRLQIFEQRYLELVKRCLRESRGFVIVLISEGKEVGEAPGIFRTGTMVQIIDWESLENGLLGITVRANHRVRIRDTRVQHDGLLTGNIDIIDEPVSDQHSLGNSYPHLITLLQSLVAHPLFAETYADIDYDSPSDVSYRLSEFLPTENVEKQSLLEVESADERMRKIDDIVDRLQA